jgi:hypothetical protein
MFFERMEAILSKYPQQVHTLCQAQGMPRAIRVTKTTNNLIWATPENI